MNIRSIFVEKRLQNTGEDLLGCMINSKTVSIRGCTQDKNQQRRFYRWINHQEITKDRLINTSVEQVKDLAKDRHVLAIQDTTEINYQAHFDRVSGLGTVGNGTDVGIFLHPLLVIDAETSQGLGFGTVYTWNRNKVKDPNYKALPIEEKESYRWISTAEAGKKNLSAASCITFISDRESDIYEFLDRIPDEKTHLLVRSRGDRNLPGNGSLYNFIEEQPIKKKFKLELPRTNKRKSRIADVNLRFSKVQIKRPKNLSDKNASPSIELSVVQVKENSNHKEAIHWLLLTTHSVNSILDAENIVNWYKQRWQIEQLFRVLKSQGLDIESSQLETEMSITKLVIVALNAAIKIMQLVLARDGNTEHKTEMMFTKDEVVCLKALLPKLEGNTEKQKNPFPPSNLAWASWIIGRLGGWTCYKSEGPIGPIVMGRGLRRFYSILDGFFLIRDTCTG